MHWLPNTMHQQDVWQWLGGGWFYYRPPDTGCMTIASLHEGDEEDEDGSYRMTVSTLDGDDYRLEAERCAAHWPVCGALNLPDFKAAIVLERDQLRQYRRTYNSRCLRIVIPREWEVAKDSPTLRNLNPNNPAVVEAAFEPEYPDYDGACALLEAGWKSVALHRHLILVGPNKLVYYRTKLLGQITDNVFVPLNPSSQRNIRILKWLGGRVVLNAA